MKILFVDDEVAEFERFMKLEFAQQHKDEIVHTTRPVGLPAVVQANPELRLIILDILWSEDLALGMDALRDLQEHQCEVPVVVYSMLDNALTLTELIPDAERLGAVDWMSKDEPLLLREARFRRAYLAGTEMQKRPRSHGILPTDATRRPNVHVAILFVDMSGFTLLTDQVGTADTVGILEMFYKVVGDAVRQNGGYVDKYIGDAVMAAFGAGAGAAEKGYAHVTAAIHAARSILAEMTPLKLNRIEPVVRQKSVRVKSEQLPDIGKCRVAIESGNVDIVRFERGNESEITFIGTPVNIASRIMSQIEPGEIWVGENANNTGAINTAEPTPTTYRNLFGEFLRYRVPN